MSAKVITFLYHEVTDSFQESGFQTKGAIPYKHTKSHFLNDIEIILKYFKKSNSVTELNRKNTDSLILTFDDGGVSAVNIAKHLSDKGLIGHFFITTSMIDKNLFLNSEQILNIRKMGHLIGSHSHDHPSIFRDLTYDEKIYQWKKSKEILENIVNEEIYTASVPGGDMDDDTIKSAGEVGIKFLFTSEPSYKPYKKYNVTVVGRVCPKNTTSSKYINAWASGKGFFQALLIRRLKEIPRVYLKFLYKIYRNRSGESS